MVTPAGPPPTLTTCTTRSVRGSMRDTVRLWALVTQTALAGARICDGAPPTPIGRGGPPAGASRPPLGPGRPPPVSTHHTLCSPELAIRAAPAPAATPSARSPPGCAGQP